MLTDIENVTKILLFIILCLTIGYEVVVFMKLEDNRVSSCSTVVCNCPQNNCLDIFFSLWHIV